jgi:hypothetical protein
VWEALCARPFDFPYDRDLFELERTKAIAWTPQAPITDAPKSKVHGLYANGAFFGRDLCHQVFGPFDAEDVVFNSYPGGISVSRPSFPRMTEKVFGGAFKEGFHKIVSNNHMHELTR